ncbi:DNA primase [Microbacterium rhizosphaerae]|uniref:DNA primase n=1 Tax=Microbacterium rhizosphaerae TaxID=1678237 RepID=A0ABZ0SJU8_9MICO|nr:DNA primase [Microbacterium rhizosphaerae]WPR87947.1 DNA primase [Microbacterium rhizosphaerae]
MPGRIAQADVDEVKARTNIADIIGERVALKSAGVGSLKGLCPFHDERTPSFHVRPQVGFYHCFGCDQSGDVYTFLREIDHVSFQEAVERLAGRIGYTLHYEDGGSAPETSGRTRLYAANAAAAEYFRAQLMTPEADIGRRFLGERGFDAGAAAHFGVGYAPKGWSGMLDALTAQGFTRDEMLAAGLVSQGQRGVYDRFRGRVIWPIRDVTGQVLGFGARRLFDDDSGPKYLNTPETQLYKKTQVLYGLDLAKRDISRGDPRRVVIVEGYTDVMACHLAGVTTAVATCGTAFGAEHMRMLRRIMGDDAAAEVVFTFDPDAAGQKAAVRAFAETRELQAQSFVAVAPEGLDPCDLRLQRGDGAVASLMDTKVPMFEFVIDQRLKGFDLGTVEGRAGALRAAAPIVADIRDSALRAGYVRVLARRIGLEIAEVTEAVNRAGRAARSEGARTEGGRTDAGRDPRRVDGGRPDQGRRENRAPESGRSGATRPGSSRPDAARPGRHDGEYDGYREVTDAYPPDDLPPIRVSLTTLPKTKDVALERDAVMGFLQYGHRIEPDLLQRAVDLPFRTPALDAVRSVVASTADRRRPGWAVDAVSAVREPYRTLAAELLTADFPARDDEHAVASTRDLARQLVLRAFDADKAELLRTIQRVPADSEEGRRVRVMLRELDADRQRILEEMQQ